MKKSKKLEKIQEKLENLRDIYRSLVSALSDAERERKMLERELNDVENGLKIQSLKKKLQNL
ncbi:MAG TPA: hypothetical protein PLV72_01125 [Candidatus Magasanikbacteria bacterium]|nr:hypothetical protein [Candidatus Magasanikbacteria bacterium]